MGSSIFEREIRKFLETQSCLVVHQIDLRGPRFIIKKTVDYVCCYKDGTFGAIEVKQTKTDSFAFSRIKPHQAAALSLVAGTKHGKAFLALNFRDVKGPGIAFLIPWDYWCDDFAKLWHKKSIQKREAITQFHEFRLMRITGGWDKQRPRLI